jgi:hypothetical protein
MSKLTGINLAMQTPMHADPSVDEARELAASLEPLG